MKGSPTEWEKCLQIIYLIRVKIKIDKELKQFKTIIQFKIWEQIK